MNRSSRMFMACVLGVAAWTATGTGRAEPRQTGTTVPEGFRLQEFLGRTWRNELVGFPLREKHQPRVEAGHTLVGPDGEPVAYQVAPNASQNGAAVVFLADLDPFETRIYRFADAPAQSKTDLEVEETADVIRLSNSRIGVAIPKTMEEGGGPIESIRLASGRWISESRMETARSVTAYAAEIVASGPVFAEVLCRIRFEGDHPWELRFRLNANEPVVVVEETFSLEDESSFLLSLSRGFEPDHLLYRFGKGTTKGSVGTLATWPIDPSDPEPLFVLEPWLHWWERERQGNWFAAYNEKGEDLVAIGALQPGVWVDPERSPETRSSSQIRFHRQDEAFVARFPLCGGRRKWMIAALDKRASLDLAGGDPHQAPLPQQHLIKHGDFPLDAVKGYVFQWEGDHDNYPRLFVTRKQLPEFRKSFRPDPDRLAQFVKNPISQYQMDGPVAYCLATNDAALERHVAETAIAWVQSAVDMYLDQDSLVTLGFAPHHQTRILTAINLADTILASERLSPELRERLRAQLAFIGYTVNRSDYWSPERGFSANPNMTTTVAAYQTAVACIVPSHPMAAAWAGRGLEELKENQLDHWSDPGGGWLEAPHYAMVSYDYLVGCFIMARNAGFGDHLYDPKMKRVIEWFAKIATPPDSRIQGWRHHPPIGNTYIREPSGQFGVIAWLWKERDPQFASEMQWMYRQQGSWPAPGVGGFFPTLAGYREMLMDESIPAKPPAYRSELFPETGVVLRNLYPGDRETSLHMIAGRNHDHYDKDSGSITVWGKGRILADDFGYYGYVTGADHNMLTSAAAPDAAIMNVTEFASADDLDYVRGVKQAWTRQIAFVKDPDPLAPNYFVVCDSLAEPAPATWRLWMTAREVVVRNQGALLVGQEDVDMDLYFALPEKADLTTETISRTSASGLTPEGRQSAITTSQTGVILELDGQTWAMAVLYPRLKTENSPNISAIAGSSGVKIESPAGVDYVFLGPERFTFQEGDVAFQGTCGAVQIRGTRGVLSLGAAGSVAARGQALASEQPASRRWQPFDAQ